MKKIITFLFALLLAFHFSNIQAQPGDCLDLDGSNDYVDVPSFSWSAGSPVTVEFWLNTPGGSRNAAFNVGNSTKPNEFKVYSPWEDNNLYWDYGDNSPAGNGRISTNYTNYIGKWTHVALVSAGSSGSFRAIYLNGELIASENASSSPGALSDLEIGRYPAGFGQPYQTGKIEEFRIWNVVRTQEQIIENMNTTIDPATSGLVAYYRFDDGSGTTVTDETGTYNGTLTNSDADEWVDSEAFNVWTGTNNGAWNNAGNWTDGIPGSSDNIHIGSGSNASALASNITVNTAVVASDGGLTITNGNLLTVSSGLFAFKDITVEGADGGDPGKITTDNLYLSSGDTIILKSPANSGAMGSLIFSDVDGEGGIKIERFLQQNEFHYIGSPIAGQSTSIFTQTGENIYTYTESAWDGSDKSAAWSKYLDGAMGVGTGYAVYSDYHNPTFKGALTDLQTTDFQANDLSYSGAANYQGWNLVANPYTSPIDPTFISSGQTNISGGIYVWDVNNYYYMVGEIVAGGASGGELTSTVIPTAQAFFIKATDATNTLSIPMSARTHGNQTFFKKKEKKELLRLQAVGYTQDEEGNLVVLDDQLVVNFDANATEDFDHQYDALKLFTYVAEVPQIYTTSSRDIDMAINTLPKAEEGMVIPCGFSALEQTNGTYEISLTECGLNIESIMLEDLIENTAVNLLEESYTFSYETGDETDRFQIRLGKMGDLTKIDQQESQNPIQVYVSKQMLRVYIPSNLLAQKLVVYDVLGKLVLQENLNSAYGQVDVSNWDSGVYIVKVVTDQQTSTQRVFVK